MQVLKDIKDKSNFNRHNTDRYIINACMSMVHARTCIEKRKSATDFRFSRGRKTNDPLTISVFKRRKLLRYYVAIIRSLCL